MVVLSSFCYPESPVVLQNDNVQVLLDRQDYGLGILYVSERFVFLVKYRNTQSLYMMF